MLDPNWIVALGTVIAAFASALAALNSAKASENWKDGLKSQRVDELVISLEICAGAIGRAVSVTQQRTTVPIEPGPISDAWERWRDAKAAYTVVSRYYGGLSRDFIGEGDRLMRDLNSFYTDIFVSADGGDRVNSSFGMLREQINLALTDQPWGSGLRRM